MNMIGKILTLTTFGESHGPAMGGVMDGVPAGVDIDLEALQRFVDRRRTGQSAGSSTRDERDRVEVLSGIWQGKTLGTPIGFIVRNGLSNNLLIKTYLILDASEGFIGNLQKTRHT